MILESLAFGSLVFGLTPAPGGDMSTDGGNGTAIKEHSKDGNSAPGLKLMQLTRIPNSQSRVFSCAARRSIPLLKDDEIALGDEPPSLTRLTPKGCEDW